MNQILKNGFQVLGGISIPPGTQAGTIVSIALYEVHSRLAAEVRRL